MTDLREELAGLETAEAFLERFAIPYDQRVVDVNRLHILQRAHDLLAGEAADLDDAALAARFAAVLAQAYADFTRSDARTEKVFAVFRRAKADSAAPGRTFVPIDTIAGGPRRLPVARG